MDTLEHEIIQLVRDQSGAQRSQVVLETRLFHDLGVAGADGAELLTEFAHRYGIDLTNVDMDKYFGPEEAATPLTFIRWLVDSSFRNGAKVPAIRVGDIVECAKAGKWLL